MVLVRQNYHLTTLTQEIPQKTHTSTNRIYTNLQIPNTNKNTVLSRETYVIKICYQAFSLLFQCNFSKYLKYANTQIRVLTQVFEAKVIGVIRYRTFLLLVIIATS
jgi:hypothetical protein